MGKPSGPSAWDRRSEAAKAYRHFYRTPAWKQFSIEYRKAHPLCEMCLKSGKYTPVDGRKGVCHHVNKDKKDTFEQFMAGPFMSVCNDCHDRIIQSAERLGYSKQIGEDGYPVDVENHPFYKGKNKAG